MGKSKSVRLEAKELGNFTRERLVAVLKKPLDSKSEIPVMLAVAALASIEPHGHRPQDEFIQSALDVLASSAIPTAGDFLWQAAEHAQNARIRIEAIRRAGPFAQAERRDLLRRWASEAFTPAVMFQNDQIDSDSIKEAALTALGQVKNPTKEDIDVIVSALSPPAGQAKFSPRVFHAANAAYWNIGDCASLLDLVRLLTNRRDDIGLYLTALAAKFSASELQPFADELRKAFVECAHQWPSDQPRLSRLEALAKIIATPAFLQDWASRYGGDALDHGRGRITMKLLEEFKEPSEGVTKGLLILAQWPNNLLPDGPILQGLTRCSAAGFGKVIARRVVEQSSDGHRRLVETGTVFRLYETMESAVTEVCQAICFGRQEHEQRRLAGTVANGALVAIEACAESMPSSATNRRRSGPEGREQQESQLQMVRDLEQLAPCDNPVVLVARLVCPPSSLPGALFVIESWLRLGEPVAQHVIRTVLREAGRSNVVAQRTAVIDRFEQLVLKSEPQQPSHRAALGAALVEEILVDGRLNRYAVDLMQRAQSPLANAAETALNGVQAEEDAGFLLERLHAEGMSSAGVLTRAIDFHRDDDVSLTEFVQARAIGLVTDLLRQVPEQKRRDALAQQLHQHFFDRPTVREAAYMACGALGGFVSIKPLRERLASEKAPKPRTAIERAIEDLKAGLIDQKPQQAQPEEIRRWLGYVADLGDPALLPHIAGYLYPLHSDHGVRRAALSAIACMHDPKALAVVKQFISETAPEGETLVLARRARMVLEQRQDADLFDLLSQFFPADADVLDPAIEYEQLLGAYLLSAVTRGLTKAQKLWEDGHWDEFITQINGIMEGVVRQVFRTQYSRMSIDQQRAEKLAGGNSYMSMLNTTEFRTTFGQLQAHCNTIQSFRRDSPTAHVMNKDGSAKDEAGSEEAHYVRSEFLSALSEAIKVLR